MLGCTSISRVALLVLLGLALNASFSRQTIAAPSDERSEGGKTQVPEEDDFTSTPFTEYGEFNEEEDEAAETKFLQYGRFFGVSLGAGYHGATGNRGTVWQGGFPLLDFKVHYWFDFNFALDLGVFTASHAISTQSDTIDVSLFNLGLDLRYYIDTKNLPAQITFASPYLVAGLGSVTKSEYSTLAGGDPARDTVFSLCAGAGLEFPIKARRAYLQLEGKLRIANFADRFSQEFDPTVPDLTGYFYSFSANVLFTW